MGEDLAPPFRRLALGDVETVVLIKGVMLPTNGFAPLWRTNRPRGSSCFDSRTRVPELKQIAERARTNNSADSGAGKDEQLIMWC